MHTKSSSTGDTDWITFTILRRLVYMVTNGCVPSVRPEGSASLRPAVTPPYSLVHVAQVYLKEPNRVSVLGSSPAIRGGKSCRQHGWSSHACRSCCITVRCSALSADSVPLLHIMKKASERVCCPTKVQTLEATWVCRSTGFNSSPRPGCPT